MFWSLFISFKLREASSSDWPPDKNTIPGIAGTIVLERVLTVNQATSAGVFFLVQLAPAVTMLGLSKSPSRIKWWSMRALLTAENTISETLAHSSIS